MRISDWSSDVCSSDLADHRCGAPITLFGGFGHTADVRSRRSKVKTSAAAAKEKLALKPASEMPKSDHCTASQRMSGAFMIESSVTGPPATVAPDVRSEETTSELQSLMRNSDAHFCLKTHNKNKKTN